MYFIIESQHNFHHAQQILRTQNIYERRKGKRIKKEQEVTSEITVRVEEGTALIHRSSCQSAVNLRGSSVMEAAINPPAFLIYCSSIKMIRDYLETQYFIANLRVSRPQPRTRFYGCREKNKFCFETGRDLEGGKERRDGRIENIVDGRGCSCNQRLFLQ